MADPIWTGHRTDSFFELDRFDDFIKFLQTFKEDAPLEFIARKKRKRVSNPQHAYRYGVVYKMIADHTGHSVDEIADSCKTRFMQRIDANGFKYVASQADMSTVESEEYHMQIRLWASITFDLIIPLPNEVLISNENPVCV